MSTIQLDTSSDKYLITLDKSMFDKEWLLRLMEKLRTEELAHQLDFDQSVEEVGETIKSDWWSKNKERFING